MRILFTFFLFCSLFFVSKAQQEFKCGVTSESWKQEMLEMKRRQAAASNQRTTNTNDIKYIPLTIHFVRHTNGTYSVNTSPDLFYKSLLSVNRMLSSINIQFYVDGAVQYINNDAYLMPVRGSADHIALLANKNANTANIWINDGWAGVDNAGFGGTSGVELADLTFTTVMHEFGHFFSLSHTFETMNGIEHVARTGANNNCSAAGDGLCDTEADPFGLTVANSQILGTDPTNLNCALTSNTKDLTGTVYTPPFNNIMSYYPCRCGVAFTQGQYSSMTVSYSLFHNAYTPITGSGIAGAATNITIAHFNGYDAISWHNAAGSVATQVEISIDNGTTWKVMSGELSGSTSTIIHDVKKGSSYLFRLRHLNSLVYSSTVSYSPTINIPLMPIQVEHAELITFPAINGLKIATASLDHTSTNNQFYSLYSPTPTINLSRGGTYPIELAIKPTGLGTYVAVWLDENADGIFNNANELKYQYASASFIYTANFNMSVGETSDTGFVRMRIRIFTEQPTLDATAIFNDTETEDYVFKIVNAEQQGTPYCSPVSYGGCDGGDYGVGSFTISSVSFTNSSAVCGVTSDGYSDFSSKTINLVAGHTYAFNETNNPGWGYQSTYLAIYLDANQNGIFDANELSFSQTQIGFVVDPITGNITVPSNAANGITRLRIRAYQNPIQDACSIAYVGETEDYSVSITGGKEARIKNITMTNITSSSMLINWQKGSTTNPTGYIIKISTDGQNFTALATIAGSATSYTASGLQPDTRYYFQFTATGTINSDTKIAYASTAISTVATAIADANLNAEVLNAFPNPVQNELYLVGAIATIDATVVLQNVLGQNIAFVSSANGNGLVIATNQLSKGVYFVTVILGDKNQVIRFIKE